MTECCSTNAWLVLELGGGVVLSFYPRKLRKLLKKKTECHHTSRDGNAMENAMISL